jgi:hypothetical protein
VWWRRAKARAAAELVPTDEILDGIIETLMRSDANVQKLLYNEEDDGEEES